MATTKQPRTLADVKADPRVERVYRDSDGLWIDLADGWRNTFDEPCGALHGIHEDTLRAALMRMSSVKPCDCAECVERLARKAVEQARKRDSVADAEPSRVDGQLTLAAESLQTPRDASAAASLIAAACFNDEIKAIVARQLLRSIVRPHDAAVAVSLEKAQDALSSLVTSFDRQYRD